MFSSAEQYYILSSSGQILKYSELSAEIKTENSNCTICTEEFSDETDIFFTFCLHSFCKPCISKWIFELDKNTCPICRTKFSYNQLNNDLDLLQILLFFQQE